MSNDSTIIPSLPEKADTPVPFDLAGASDIGLQRKQNQDHFLVAELRRVLSIIATDVPLANCNKLYGADPGQLLVVADGMGGHDDGEIASKRAVQACARYVLNMMEWFLKLSAQNVDDFVDELSECLNSAQQALWDEQATGELKMGTTLTLAYLLWPRMYVVHAGDSRCYVLRGGELTQLTTDHTVAQKLLEEHEITAEEAARSHWRHILWNCVGGNTKVVQPEVVRFDLQVGDQILLCSDGLTGMVDDELIRSTLESGKFASNAVERLISLANAAGGKDNITVVVANCRVGCLDT